MSSEKVQPNPAKLLSRQFNAYFRKRFHFHPGFRVGKKDMHEITPFEASFCRNNLIREKLHTDTNRPLAVYDVFARTGSDCISFLAMSKPHVNRFAANTTEHDRRMLQRNLKNFAKSFSKKHPNFSSPNTSIQTIEGNWRNMQDADWQLLQAAHEQHNLDRLDVLYIDPPRNVLDQPETVIKNIAECVLEPVLQRTSPQLVCIKAWWPAQDMTGLPSHYHHYLTVRFTDFHSPFYMHFYEPTNPQNENLLPKEMSFIASGLCRRIFQLETENFTRGKQFEKYKLKHER